jgi:HAMP domain-containing protein
MAYAVERGISLASDNPQVSGSEVRFEVASVTGYPKNFTIGITEIEIGAKDKFTWATQEVLVEAKSYQPNRINVDLSQPHSISGSLGSLEIDAELADLSVLFKPNLQLSLGSLEALFKNLTISFKGLPDVEVETMSAQLDASPNTEKNYQVIAQIEKLNLSNLMIGTGRDYQIVQNISLSAEVELSRPLDRLAIANASPQLQALLLHEALINYGETSVLLNGKLALNELGALNGNINFTVQNWKPLFGLAKDMGYVEPELEDFFYSILINLANQDESEESLTIPLAIANNAVSYGALTLSVLP